MTYTDPGDSNVHGERVPDSQDPAQVGLFARLGDGGPVDNPPRARTTDPKTSHDAAASMVSGASVQRAQIVDTLRMIGHPMTADELDETIGWRPTTAGRRLKELEATGNVERLDETRPTRSGRNANLWEVV